METEYLTLYSFNKDRTELSEFEEAFYNSRLRYSLRHLTFTEGISHEIIIDALQKSLKVCHLAGINSQHHFKKIYVYDAEISTMQVDWLMSKKGFNLMVMQIPSLNEKMARWLCELADL